MDAARRGHPAHKGFIPGAQSDVDEAHGLFGRAAARPGNAGDADAKIAPRRLARTFGHGPGHGLAHGPVRFKQGGGHAEESRLRVVGVGDETRSEDIRSPGDIRNAFGHQPSGAGFRSRQPQAAFTQKRHDHAFQILHVHAVDHISVTAANFLDHRTAQGLGLLLALGPGGHPDEHLILLGVGRRRRVGGVREIGNLERARTFPEPEGADHGGVDHGVGGPTQERHHVALQHGHQFRRRTGQHDDDFPRRRAHAAARRGADVVGKGRAAFGQHGLLALVFPHGRPPPEVFLQAAQAVFMQSQRHTRHGSNGFLGQVIVGGAKAARGDDHVAPAEGLLKGGAQTSGIIPHGAGVQQVYADGGKLAGYEGGIRIDGMPEQKFRTYGNDFSIHDEPGLQR